MSPSSVRAAASVSPDLGGQQCTRQMLLSSGTVQARVKAVTQQPADQRKLIWSYHHINETSSNNFNLDSNNVQQMFPLILLEGTEGTSAL